MGPQPTANTHSPATGERSDDVQWAARRARIGPFVDAHYRWPGVWKMHRSALGLDLLKAPANVLLAPFALGTQMVAHLLLRLGAVRVARCLQRVPFGFRTTVEGALSQRLQHDLLGPGVSPATTAALVEDYAETRRAVSDLATAFAVGLVGLLAVHRFTLGSVSAGQELAANVVHYRAVHNFILGDRLGGWYYHFFPPHTSIWNQVVGVLVVAALMAAFSAFSGLVTDPLQARLGVHQARLEHWLRTCRGMVEGSVNADYRPRDPYIARLVDFADALRGIIS